MKNSEVVFFDNEKAKLIGLKDLESEGFQCKLWDLTETKHGGYAIQYRHSSLKNTPWDKLEYS